jgi:hypothetical protein
MDASYITVPIYYFGGIALAFICIICAFVKGSHVKYWPKSAKLLWIAAVLLLLAQGGCWMVAVETGNAI